MENRDRKKHLSTDPDARMVPRPEIIAVIAEELRNSKAEAQLNNSIKAAMKIFDEYDPLFSRQAKAAEIKSAEQLAGTVATFDQQLEKAPPALKHYLFTPLAGRRVSKVKEFSAPKQRSEKHFRRAMLGMAFILRKPGSPGQFQSCKMYTARGALHQCRLAISNGRRNKLALKSTCHLNAKARCKRARARIHMLCLGLRQPEGGHDD